MEAFVYCWTDHKTNKLYIGSHKGNPNDGYICSSKLMKKEYKERPNDFTRQIIAEGKYKDIRKLEEVILESVDARKDPQFYNQHNGGKNFYIEHHTEKTKKKISTSQIGRKHSEDTKQKMSLAWIGRQVSEDTKQKMSLSHTGKKLTEEHKEKMRKPKSDEWKENIRKSLVGKKLSKETKLKISLSRLGRKHSEETKSKMSKTRKLMSANKEVGKH